MANTWARDRATLFYVGFGSVGLAIVALGFGVTYVLPMALRTFSGPWFVHLHGASALAWILLFVGPALIVEHSVEFALFDQEPLRSLGQWVYGVLT